MASDIVAIDVHIHLSDEVTQKAKGARTAQMAKYFGRERPPVSIDELADQYRARKMMAVLMNTRDETVTGLPPVPNDHVAGAVAPRRERRETGVGGDVMDVRHESEDQVREPPELLLRVGAVPPAPLRRLVQGLQGRVGEIPLQGEAP